jgi:hypothetical protein
MVSMRIRIQLFISMRIQIDGATSTRMHADPDPGQSFKSQKVDFSHEKNRCLIGKKQYIPTKVKNYKKPL